MALEADILVDRRRLKRRLGVWRLLALLLAIAVVGVLLARTDGLPTDVLGKQQVARVTISGVIQEDRDQLRLLDRLADAGHVRAVVLSINSPGGTTTGGEALHAAVARLKERKPVVAVMSTVGTSAAYMTALAADRIFARANTVTGSVGVIFQWAEVTELLETLGVKVEGIKSGRLKATPSPFEPTDEESRRVAQELVDEAKDWFVGLVAKERDLDPALVPGLTEGRVYSGRMAVDLRLIDAIGGEEAARTWLEETRGVSADLDIVDWRPERSSRLGVLGSLAEALAGQLGLDVSVLARVVESSGLGGARLDGLVSLWHPSLY